MFACRICETFKSTYLKKICERLLLKPVQNSPGLPFFDNFTLLAQIGTYVFVSQFTVLFDNSPFTTIDTAIIRTLHFWLKLVHKFLYHNLQFRLTILPSLLLILLKSEAVVRSCSAKKSVLTNFAKFIEKHLR